MSRDQIIEAIEKHEDLKLILPSNYKKLTKEALCDNLFSNWVSLQKFEKCFHSCTFNSN